MNEQMIRVAITHGDTNGIGYELILKTFDASEMLELCTPIVYGSPKVATFHRNTLGLQTPYTIVNKAEDAKDGRLNLLAVIDEETKVDFGIATAESKAAATKAMAKAGEDATNGLFDVLITSPTTETSPVAPLPMLVNGQLRIAMATMGLPLKQVPGVITKELIWQKTLLLHKTLRRDFRISKPRIAILAMNTSPSEEEEQILKPAIEALGEQKVNAFGPYPADTFFGEGYFNAFDAVLALYDNQALAPFKTLDDGEGVSYAAGQELVQTAPLTSDALKNAGKNMADERSMRHAIYLAIDVFRNRLNYDEPMKNPLKKLYHEKRDESEKVRFNIPKAKDNAEKENKQ